MSLNKILKRRIKKPKENSHVLRYFCRTNMEIQHLKNKPENGKEIGQMRFKKLGFIITIIDQINEGKVFTNSKIYNRIPISILKSNLQKAIRLGNLLTALKTSLYLIRISPIDFFRRISIIYIEDVYFDQHYDYLIWLMCSVSKKYRLKIDDINWCLGLVKHLIHKKQLWCPSNPNIKFNNIRDKILSGNLDYKIFTLAYRYEFNGMPCELNLILNYIESFDFDNYYKVNQIPTVLISEVGIFRPKNILLVSIDFHCSSIIKYLLSKYKDENWDEKYLKSIIWKYRSSINYRNNDNKKTNSFYKCIKRDCDTYAELIIKQFI